MAGLEPKYMVYDGDPWFYSPSKNARRRHMSENISAVAEEYGREITRLAHSPDGKGPLL
jgi:hypothetical protein